jgi:hypothetical protein
MAQVVDNLLCKHISPEFKPQAHQNNDDSNNNKMKKIS